MFIPIRLLALFAFIGAPLVASAAVRLPYVFTHHMVLQRDMPAPIWGTAEPGEKVTVRFDGQEHAATADASGNWRVTLDPLSPGAPRELVITSDRAEGPVVVEEVLVGDVWICSGQSNMQWALRNAKDSDLTTLTADRPEIRLLKVNQLGSPTPLDDIDQPWELCTPESVQDFSAVGYHFGVQLQESLGVPIGLIRNAWGGSACEAWTPRERLTENELFKPYLDQWRKTESQHDEAALRAEYAERLAKFYENRAVAYAARESLPRVPGLKNPLFQQHRPANLYNARVAPIAPFAIKGVIWYQGESNAGRAYAYRDLFPMMIQSWRDHWAQGDFPFYWVQLADFKKERRLGSEDSEWAELREAQTMTRDRLPNVGEAVIIDLGEANDIHPRNKRDVGLRLARLALAETYGLKIKGRSARFDRVEFADGKAVVSFRDVGGGLKTFDGVAPAGFALAGEDRVFHPAVAKVVDKAGVELSSSEVPVPVAVRYAWAFNPVVNLYDSAWLPVTPFRTDDWPGVTQPK
ncbi:hypothetical protein MalM25_23440 [Planctomycetes bacterium MalM25]|nr:hypothetical protein MalM25_23440 [Planctomycetes bacterium MalM25]